MTPMRLLRELETRGITLRADGDMLRYRAPSGALSEELRSALVAHKTALLTLVGSVTRHTEVTKGSEVPVPAPAEALVALVTSVQATTARKSPAGNRADRRVVAPGPSLYLVGGDLAPDLYAVGYRLCEVCRLLTLRRSVCLRCSPRTPLPPEIIG